MRIKDLKASLSSFWGEFRKEKSGMMGLILFALFIVVVLAEPLLTPYDKAEEEWGGTEYWKDLPMSVPPAWYNFFLSKDLPETVKLSPDNVAEKGIGSMTRFQATFNYNFTHDVPPQDLIYCWNIPIPESSMISIELQTPSGEKLDLLKMPLSAGGNRIRIPILKDPKIDKTIKKILDDRGEKDANITNLIEVLFTEKGSYVINVTLFLSQIPEISPEEMYFVLPGRVHGMMGTDTSKRDIWCGIIIGLKYALLIGLLVAIVSVIVGVLWGITSAYYGGWVDDIMQRIFEIFWSIPMLPILIVLAAIFEPNLWIFIIIMCVLSWSGPVKVVRSMALQVKEETFIEAAHGLGGSNVRIILKHIFPLLVPYAFATMALFVPGAIVAEATVSVLGLGDATKLTWGQILRVAYEEGAVTSGLWWWVIFPGLAIALVGMTFAFIGFAMDTILNPKLRTR